MNEEAALLGNYVWILIQFYLDNKQIKLFVEIIVYNWYIFLQCHVVKCFV